VTLREIRDRGGGKHTREEYVDPCTRETGDDCRFKELSTGPGIASDDSRRTPTSPSESTRVAEDMCRRSGKGKRKLGGEIAIGESPHTVGAEEATAHGAPISACCTEAPCGPS
jgi:hypothetical protein